MRSGMRPSCEKADDGTRTRDLLITNQLLYQLSYIGAFAGAAKMAPASETGKAERF